MPTRWEKRGTEWVRARDDQPDTEQDRLNRISQRGSGWFGGADEVAGPTLAYMQVATEREAAGHPPPNRDLFADEGQDEDTPPRRRRRRRRV